MPLNNWKYMLFTFSYFQ